MFLEKSEIDFLSGHSSRVPFCAFCSVLLVERDDKASFTMDSLKDSFFKDKSEDEYGETFFNICSKFSKLPKLKTLHIEDLLPCAIGELRGILDMAKMLSNDESPGVEYLMLPNEPPRYARPDQEVPTVTYYSNEQPSLDEISELVGGFVEIIRIRLNGEEAQMIINDSGKLMPDIPLNPEATAIFEGCYGRGSDWIAGNVAILTGDALWD